MLTPRRTAKSAKRILGKALNLELQPWDEAPQKDKVESCLARAAGAGKITLDEARRRIWSDWRAAGKACE